MANKSGSSYRTALPIVLSLFAALVLPSQAATERHYLSDTNMAVQLLPAPPERASPEQAVDLAEVALVYRARTPAEETLARSEKRVFIFSFSPAVGSFFQTNRFPKAETFFRRVLKETDIEVDVGKDLWNRPRPYLIDTNLLDGGEVEKFSGSYPSGHSTRGTVLALLLAEMFPEHREAILSRGREIGWHRVILGKHYPTDVYAGRVLAQAIVRQLKSNRAFRHDFKEAEAEIKSWMQDHAATRERSIAKSGP